jgi:hypothetical protein
MAVSLPRKHEASVQIPIWPKKKKGDNDIKAAS